MTVKILHGDCLALLPTLAADSVDAVVTDPPYGLEFMGKEWDGSDGFRRSLNEADVGRDNAFGRTSARAPEYRTAGTGQKGKPGIGERDTEWVNNQGWNQFRCEACGHLFHGGSPCQCAEPKPIRADNRWNLFQAWCEAWSRECLRVLKPGGHLLAFGGSRTYHRLACAVEDAGFEVRDQIQWLYGSGFPKSHDVSKGIDRNHHADKIGWFGKWLRQERATRKISQKELAERGGFFDKINHGGLVANWELGYSIPTAEDFNKVCKILSVDFPPIEEFKREVIGRRKVNRGLAFTSEGPSELDVTAPASDEAIQWEGWGTALKPAHEPIVMARKPLIGTVAANVLKHGTGALNIDGCRVGNFVSTQPPGYDAMNQTNFEQGYRPNAYQSNGREGEASAERRYTDKGSTNFAAKPGARGGSPAGRWPANVITDGSDEVISAFPDSNGQQGDLNATGRERPTKTCFGDMAAPLPHPARNDSGSAARFFYTAKADKGDRLSSKHPTVKPVDLMAYLCRLVTPPKGIVLDPFAGSGATGMACLREGFDCILIEREAEYVADIERRVAHVSGADAPLFAGAK